MFSQIIEIFSRPMLQPSFLFHGKFELSGRDRTSRHHLLARLLWTVWGSGWRCIEPKPDARISNILTGGPAEDQRGINK
jgi:hypothetical protein